MNKLRLGLLVCAMLMQGIVCAQADVNRDYLRSYLTQKIDRMCHCKMNKQIKNAQCKPATLVYLQNIAAAHVKATGVVLYYGEFDINPTAAVISVDQYDGSVASTFSTESSYMFENVQYATTFIWTIKGMRINDEGIVKGGALTLETIEMPFAEYKLIGDTNMKDESNWGIARSNYLKAKQYAQPENGVHTRQINANLNKIDSRYNALLASADKAYKEQNYAVAQSYYAQAQQLDNNEYVQGQLSAVRTYIAAQQLVSRTQKEIARVKNTTRAYELAAVMNDAGRLCNRIDDAIAAQKEGNVAKVTQLYYELKPLYELLCTVTDEGSEAVTDEARRFANRFSQVSTQFCRDYNAKPMLALFENSKTPIEVSNFEEVKTRTASQYISNLRKLVKERYHGNVQMEMEVLGMETIDDTHAILIVRQYFHGDLVYCDETIKKVYVKKQGDSMVITQMRVVDTRECETQKLHR
ncbi:MAG: hypothetical protein KBT04_00070 [Bacteroidales bacterium]|nr:hypothetical protein [Candidatus Colimorpha onthohippi]